MEISLENLYVDIGTSRVKKSVELKDRFQFTTPRLTAEISPH